MRSRAVTLTVLILSACQPDARSDAAQFTFHDSAGIAIVENSQPLWQQDDGWRIQVEPSLSIGVQSGDPRYEFADVWAVSRSSNGTIAVGDGGARHIVLYTGAGEYVRTVGRRGAGPGEFQEGPVVTWTEGDTLVAWDPGARRLSWFDAEGTLVRDQSLLDQFSRHPVRVPRGASRGWQVSPAGLVLALGVDVVPPRDRHAAGQRWVYQYSSFLISPDTVIALGVQGSEESVSTASGISVPNPFDSWVRPALRRDGTAVLGSEIGELTERTSHGATARVIRAAVRRSAVSGSTFEALRDSWSEMPDSRVLRPSDYLQHVQTFDPPDSLPALRAIYVDRLGNTWASRIVEPNQSFDRVLEVFNADGRWLGAVDVPSGVSRIMDIDTEYVLAVAVGDLGVQYVNLHPILKD